LLDYVLRRFSSRKAEICRDDARRLAGIFVADMSDLADLAQIQCARLEESQLQARKPAAPEACGHCLNCGEPLSDGLRWCDAACRDDWQRRAAFPVIPAQAGIQSTGGTA